MGLPRFALQMILKPMTKMAIESYKQGKEDHEKGEYDEKSFEKQIKKLIKDQF